MSLRHEPRRTALLRAFTRGMRDAARPKVVAVVFGIVVVCLAVNAWALHNSL